MDTKVCIRFVRSDEREFLIDGTDWKIPSKGLDGFGSYENDITTVDNAVGDGGIIVSDRIAPKDRTVTAISRNPYPVSYTHLDVYKRQTWFRCVWYN